MKETGSIMDLKGCIPWDGPTVSIEEMNRVGGEAIMADWERFEQQVRTERLLKASSETNLSVVQPVDRE